MPRSRLTSILSSAFAVALMVTNSLFAVADPPVGGAAAIRQRLEQSVREKQTATKELTLREGAVSVSQQRLQELEQQLQATETRLAAEKAELEKLTGRVAEVDQTIATLTAQLPQHEAADALVATADRATARHTEMLDARKQLQTQLSSLRKSSVEWRSKSTEAEQQLAAITAQRPELDKKFNETKAALEGPETAVTTSKAAVDAATVTMNGLVTALAEDEARLVNANESRERILRSTASLEKSLSTLREAAKLTGVDSAAAIQGLEKAIADFAPATANVQALVTGLTATRDQHNQQLVAAKAEVEKKTAELVAANAAAEPARAAHKAASDALVAANTKETELKSLKADGEQWQKTLNAQLIGLEPSLQKLEAELKIVGTETLLARRHAENALEPLGRFVSFSRHVAPVLAQRCVACHNTRSPGGRLNLDSFAAMGKGGESGAAFAAHKSTDSLMLSMIQDGSMPKDAEPLKPEELAVLTRWVDVGAPLDAGVSPSADLFDIMPEFAQPQPPREYRAAIPVTAIAFSPDGSQLLSSGYHEVLLWNTADGTLIRRISNLAERVYDVEYSADGQSVVVASGTPGQLGELKLFNVADGSLIRTLVRSRDAIFATAVSPDGTRVACAGADRSISVVNVSTGEVPVKIEDHADWVMDINWSPNGQRLVSASKDKTCKVFDAATGNPVITFPAHGEPVYTAAFLADSATVVSGGGDKRVRVWQSADAKELRGLGGFGGDIFRVRVTAGDLILSASGDGSVHEHKAADGALVRKFSGHRDWVYTVAENTVRKLIASGSYDGEVRIWNAEDGTALTTFSAVPRDQAVAKSNP